MINIFVMGAILTTISIGLAYITYKLVNSEDFEILNEIPVEYNDFINY